MSKHLLCITALALMVGCGGSAPPSSERPRIRLQLNWFPEPEFGGMYAARERGLFEKHGLDVEILQGGADVPAAQLVASGRVEVAVVAAEQLLTLRARGGRARAVYACFQRAPRVVIVRGDSEYLSLAQLWSSEATVLAQDGLAFIHWLSREHGGEKLTLVPYAGSAAPLIAGTADAMQGFATAEPIQLDLDGVPVRSFLVADAGFDPYDVVLAVNEDFLSREPEAVRTLVAALREGWRSYLDDPGPINAVMAEMNQDMSHEVMDRAAAILSPFVESKDTHAHGLGWMTRARWARLATQLEELGILDEPADVDAAFLNPLP